uniref:Uncharacterized protein n=1 Tax=Glossina austeni TaxID=7395 RepID=A0A1A9VMG8_GLOAU
MDKKRNLCLQSHIYPACVFVGMHIIAGLMPDMVNENCAILVVCVAYVFIVTLTTLIINWVPGSYLDTCNSETVDDCQAADWQRDDSRHDFINCISQSCVSQDLL